MRLVVAGVADEGLEFVVDAAWLPGVSGRGLEGDRGRAVRGQLEEEREGVLAELLYQAFLETQEARKQGMGHSVGQSWYL